MNQQKSGLKPVAGSFQVETDNGSVQLKTINMKCRHCYCDKPVALDSKKEVKIRCVCALQPAYCSQKCMGEDWDREHKYECQKELKLTVADIREYDELLESDDMQEIRLVSHKNVRYAVKVLSKSKLKKTQKLKAFEKSVAVRMRLQHASILTAVEPLEDYRRKYVVYEYCDWPRLRTVLQEQHVKSSSIRTFFQQVCLCVKYLHENGIVHGFIHPQDIQVHHESVKMCGYFWDFGEDHCNSEDPNTLQYLAPELLDQQRASKESDCWALGVLLYEMTHGVCPFASSKNRRVARRIQGCHYECKSTLAPEIKDLISRLLVPDPAARLTVSQILSHMYLEHIVIQLAPNQRINLKLPDYGLVEGVVTHYNKYSCTFYFEDIGSSKTLSLFEVQDATRLAKLDEEAARSKRKFKVNPVQIESNIEFSRSRTLADEPSPTPNNIQDRIAALVKNSSKLTKVQSVMWPTIDEEDEEKGPAKPVNPLYLRQDSDDDVPAMPRSSTTNIDFAKLNMSKLNPVKPMPLDSKQDSVPVPKPDVPQKLTESPRPKPEESKSTLQEPSSSRLRSYTPRRRKFNLQPVFQNLCTELYPSSISARRA